MSEFDDIEDGEAGEGSPDVSPAVVESAEAAAGELSLACLSCGAASVAVFCANCGQKNDDLRRSIFLLARDFVEDTFSFDSRMWRTLGALVVAPGVVATNYAHGKRSRYTPPVRLFLVVSFIFFLTLSLTQTLFVAIQITENENAEPLKISFLEVDDTKEARAATGSDGEGVGTEIDCDLKASLDFFVRAANVKAAPERWETCMQQVNEAAVVELANAKAQAQEAGAEQENLEEIDAAANIFSAVVDGVAVAIEDPKAFNDAFNRWLPRMMFLMTPIFALILGVFIRGKDALFFDHMVLSLYGHAVGFAMTGAAIFLTQLGIPYAGLGAALVLVVYFTVTLKRAYGRGWVKTIYSSLMSGFIYLVILFAIVIGIVAKMLLQG